MNHLIFDTETTGFYNPKLAPTHVGQARVIQLAAVLLDDDLNEAAQYNTLIKPTEYYTMSSGAFNAHGISLEQCAKEGREHYDVFNGLSCLLNDNICLVAHNIKFDLSMLKVEFENLNRDKPNLEHQNICTMELMTPICRLPLSRKGMFGQKYKWPKLIEAMTFIGKQFQGREHDGLSDARACAEVYRWLIANGHVKHDVEIKS